MKISFLEDVVVILTALCEEPTAEIAVLGMRSEKLDSVKLM